MASVEILDVVCYDSVVRGHHIYKTIWTPFIGEILTLNCKEDNSYDSCTCSCRICLIRQTDGMTNACVPVHVAYSYWYIKVPVQKKNLWGEQQH